MFNVLNGGRHADNNVDFQEYMIVPIGAESFSEALRVAAETFHQLKVALQRRGYETSVGYEGGFAPRSRAQMVNRYPKIRSLEDGLAEDDRKGWVALTRALGERLQLVGDDIFLTNPAILKIGIERKVANVILIKLNQIGTVTETVQCVRLAHENGGSSMRGADG